jgi:hypothetical protein
MVNTPEIAFGSYQDGFWTVWRRLGVSSFPLGVVSNPSPNHFIFMPHAGISLSADELSQLSEKMEEKHG